MTFSNRITEMLGVEIPIVQAPMGWIARSRLASAVSNAGALGIIETSSGELDQIREEIIKMRALTDKPFGVNIAQAFVRDPNIVEFVIEQGVKFVTTSAGNPERYTQHLKSAGLTVFHVVPSLAAALKAVECGVDGAPRKPTRCFSTAIIRQPCERSEPCARAASKSRRRSTPCRRSAMPSRSASAAIWKPRSRFPAKSADALTPCGPSAKSSWKCAGSFSKW